jgi:hypothetical protein
MIGMEMGHEDGADGEAGAEPHHLPLGSLPAVEQHQVSFPLNGEATHVPSNGGAGCGGAEEGDSYHSLGL